jgi:kynurenine formamidase
MSTHTGTHVDARRHFFDDGAGTDVLPLEMLIARTRVIEIIAGLNLLDVDPGIDEMHCFPLRIVGADGAPARVVLRRS